jgi:YggT family protein
MGSSYSVNAAVFLIQTAFELYILIILLRFLFQWFRADFYNPISQFLVKATSPVLRPLRRLIPGVGGIDVAALVLMIGLQMLEIFFVALLMGYPHGVMGMLILAIAELLRLTLKVFLVSIIIQVILSWISPGNYNPAVALIDGLAEPLLRPVRNLLPSLGGLDLSPVVVLVLLQVATMILVDPLTDIGRGLM